MAKELDNKKMWESLIKHTTVSWIGTLVKKALKDQGFKFDGGHIVPIETEDNSVSGQNKNQISGQMGGQKPKFKEGDWIVFNGLTLYINEVVQGYYRTISKGGIPNSYDWDIDNAARLWTIKEAKDGDVLATLDYILIFKERLEDNGGVSHCLYDFTAFTPCFNWNEDRNWYFGKEAIVHPATKEQCDTLLKAMADEGYTFDFDKKELKKIEQEPALSEEDKENFKHLTDEIVCLGNNRNSSNRLYYDRLIKFIDDLKNRVQPKEKWRDKDERMLDRLIAYFEKQVAFTDDDNPRYANWLKSLKDRCTWKPSGEQMHYLSWIANIKLGDSVVEQEVSKHLNELLEDLKKLREE